MKTYKLKLMPTSEITKQQEKDLLTLGFKKEYPSGVWTYRSDDTEDMELTIDALERGREVGIIDAEFEAVNWTLTARKK